MIRAFFMSAALIGSGLLAYAGWIEPRSLVVRTVEVGQGERSVRIVLLADLHAGGLHMPPSQVSRIVKAVSALEPDLVHPR